jgi:hypothetical protein
MATTPGWAGTVSVFLALDLHWRRDPFHQTRRRCTRHREAQGERVRITGCQPQQHPQYLPGRRWLHFPFAGFRLRANLTFRQPGASPEESLIAWTASKIT